jgi:hypothetical protein
MLMLLIVPAIALARGRQLPQEVTATSDAHQLPQQLHGPPAIEVARTSASGRRSTSTAPKLDQAYELAARAITTPFKRAAPEIGHQDHSMVDRQGERHAATVILSMP